MQHDFWCHYYLHQPGHTRLVETFQVIMYWFGMCTSICNHLLTCKSCQNNLSSMVRYALKQQKLPQGEHSILISLVCTQSRVSTSCVTMFFQPQAGKGQNRFLDKKDNEMVMIFHQNNLFLFRHTQLKYYHCYYLKVNYHSFHWWLLTITDSVGDSSLSLLLCNYMGHYT